MLGNSWLLLCLPFPKTQVQNGISIIMISGEFTFYLIWRCLNMQGSAPLFYIIIKFQFHFRETSIIPIVLFSECLVDVSTNAMVDFPMLTNTQNLVLVVFNHWNKYIYFISPFITYLQSNCTNLSRIKQFKIPVWKQLLTIYRNLSCCSLLDSRQFTSKNLPATFLWFS